ncbi:MAG: glycosyltransferase family 2 protein [Cyclobacteriaceae bacterium]
MSLVSVIMPVYNTEKFLRDAIDSVIGQTHQEWELLIVNDGSTDGSAQIVDDYDDSRIKYFEQENKGVSTARNVGLSKMSGDYFCFLDADDMLSRDSLSSRLSKFENPEVAFVDGVIRSYDEQMKNEVGEFKPTYTGYPLSQLLKLSSSCFFGITWMIRRDSDMDYIFDEKMSHAEDLWFFIQLASRKLASYSFVNEPIYYRREVSGSAMSNLDKLATGYYQLLNKVREAGIANPEELATLKSKIRSVLIKSAIYRLRFDIVFKQLIS